MRPAGLPLSFLAGVLSPWVWLSLNSSPTVHIAWPMEIFGLGVAGHSPVFTVGSRELIGEYNVRPADLPVYGSG